MPSAVVLPSGTGAKSKNDKEMVVVLLLVISHLLLSSDKRSQALGSLLLLSFKTAYEKGERLILYIMG
jgi:hypothetical protein